MMRYRRWEWRLVGNRTVRHELIGVAFMIWPCGEALTAICVHVDKPKLTLSDDVDALQKLAPRAYLDAVGFRTKTNTELKRNR